MAGFVVANVNKQPGWRARLTNERRKSDDRWKAKRERIEQVKSAFAPVTWDFLPTK